MYFQTLQLLAVVFFVCGVLQANAIDYYKSPAYSDSQVSRDRPMLLRRELIFSVRGQRCSSESTGLRPPRLPQVGVPALLRGSAVCTRTQMVCLDWECWTVGSANLCNLGQPQAWLDLTMTLLLLIFVAILGLIQNSVSASLDESIQTAQDYSVMVDDPGPEDNDPKEWQKFFSQFGHVTFVTIAKNNGPLIKAMAERRAIMREIIMMIGNGEASVEEDDDGVLDTTWEGKSFKTKINELADSQRIDSEDPKSKTRDLIMKSGLFGMKPMAKWAAALAKINVELNAVLEAAATEEGRYIPSKVFITFETELAQRRCLKALTQGAVTAAFDMNKDKMDPAYIWKNDNILCVKEAPEPSEVFWEDVQVTFQMRVKQQSVTFAATLVLVFGSILCCKLLQLSLGAGGAALWISITNVLVPTVLRKLCFNVEDHVSMNDQQLSLFMKLTFFRWMNTAVVIYLITNFSDFLTVVAMKQVQAVIMADAITTPLIRTLNPADAINQLIISNYALTQEKMNSYFLGTLWFPAERYADMTKSLFLALFYSSLFPAGLFLTCFGYSFAYTVDKYSLLRSWRTPAEIDDDITKISRGHITFAVYCHAVMSMVFYAEFPFDNVCKDSEAGVLEWWRFRDAKAAHNVQTDEIYMHCDQSVGLRVLGVFFGNSIARDSMHGKQERVVKVFGVLCFILTVLLFIIFFGEGIVMGTYYLFHGRYSADTDANDAHFTDCDIQAYIPNITHSSLAYPLVAADVKAFESRYLPFELPSEDLYQVQSLHNKFELPFYSKGELDGLFSSVTYFPPPEGLVEEEAPAKKPGVFDKFLGKTAEPKAAGTYKKVATDE